MYKNLIPGNDIYFDIMTANRVMIGSKLIEFTQQKLVKLSFIERNKLGTIVSFSLEAQYMNGTALIHEWAADMDEFQTPLIFLIDDTNSLISVLNRDKLLYKWHQYSNDLLEKYSPEKEVAQEMVSLTSEVLNDDEKFLAGFKGYSFWRFFFTAPFLGDNSEEKKLLLKNYFGMVDLPLKVKSKWTKTRTGLIYKYSLENQATLDTSQFDRKNFARMLKDLIGTFNPSAELAVDMEESFSFNDNNSLVSADLFLETNVHNWYTVTSAHQLKQISYEIAEELKEKLKMKSADVNVSTY